MPYELQVSDNLEDSSWDAFLAATPGGHHVQTSLWARVKALLGWKSIRVLVHSNGRIVAGAQVLYRQQSFLGAVGYAAKAPVIAADDMEAAELVLRGLREVVSKRRIRLLAVQPPNNGEKLELLLQRSGYVRTSFIVEPPATTQIDLTCDGDSMLAKMDSKTRYNIRLGLRKGMTVREGDESDLSTYYEMLKATSVRQGFDTFSEEYFVNMWRLLHPPGYMQLFLVQFEGVVVAAQLAVTFGDTVVNKLSVWSGEHGANRPNEVLQWHAITWGKAHGYHYYDFEGISQDAAKLLVQGQPLPDSMRQTVTSFKVGFGGTVMLLPGVYALMNPLLAGLYRLVPDEVQHSQKARAVLQRFRTA